MVVLISAIFIHSPFEMSSWCGAGSSPKDQKKEVNKKVVHLLFEFCVTVVSCCIFVEFYVTV